MIWQPIDFQKIVSLDQSLIEQLHKYLQEKEALLAKDILSALPEKKDKKTLEQKVPFKLAEAADAFSSTLKKLAKSKKSSLTEELLLEMAKLLEHFFWEYVEVLEGCIKELFQQLEQVEFSLWGQKIAKVLDNLQEMVEHHLEDLSWTIRKLQIAIEEARRKLDGKNPWWVAVGKSVMRWTPLFGTALLQTLKKSERYLRLHHKKHATLFAEYISLDAKIKQIMKKLGGYEILTTLEKEQQEQYRHIYYIVKFWQHDQKGHLVPVYELVRSLLQKVSIEDSITLLQKYRDAIKAALFHQGRLLKRSSSRIKEVESKKKIDQLMLAYRAEILSLGSSVSRYRDLLLRTDPNPYVRSRWGFTEGIVGPEPAQTKKLQNLEYEFEYLEELLGNLQASIQKAHAKEEKSAAVKIDPGIVRVLHEMSQPFTSYGIVKKRAEQLVEYIAEMDELGSTNPQITSYVGQVFSKALRADWKYHALHEIPKFHELFAIHVGLVQGADDQKHLSRMKKFSKVIKEIGDWVALRETRKHVKEIEYDINDLKGYLQDFLAQVQWLEKDMPKEKAQVDALIEDIALQLLLYRNTFAEFFHKLDTTSLEGKRLRNKFLFIDQYFESVEQRLHQIKHIEG